MKPLRTNAEREALKRRRREANRHPQTRAHNYHRPFGDPVVRAVFRSMRPFRVARIEHDDWCREDLFGDYCNCNPVITVERTVPSDAGVN